MKIFVGIFLFFTFSSFAQVCGTQGNLNSKSTVMTDEEGNFRIWKKGEAKELTYCINRNFRNLKPKIQRALEIAAQDWMDSGNFKIIYVPEADTNCHKKNSAETLFKISMNSSRRYPYAARAFFPYDERNTITFKKSYVQKSFEELLRIARHEFGHVLGLRHEHIRPENPLSESCQESSPYRAVNEYDSDSIMHYSRCGGTGTTELSLGDKEGIAILYPFIGQQQ
ncbi:MAG: matrixin family metalloprotease [Halobacteriovoraceae bacterium]|nr:matrixin family metalloprotease [Halobacteriovoraceae bacterium]